MSKLSFGASALGGVFGPVDETTAVRAVHAALDCGINLFDVAPAYGSEQAEIVLGKALRDTPRNRYSLSTKVGKYTQAGGYGVDTLDYSRERIRRSFHESAARLGVDYFDVLHIHDIEYQDRKHTTWALTEGLEAVTELKREGRIGAVGFGFYPADLWEQVLQSVDFDVALIHNHYCINDTRLENLIPLAQAADDVGIINGSPFASGLLTDAGAPSWHPASQSDRALFCKAAEFCRRTTGQPITRLAIQFATQHPLIPTTLFSSADPASVVENVRWSDEPCDAALLKEVRQILAPVFNREWNYV